MKYRFANEEDCALILSFIRLLADYEKMSDQVVATEELLHKWIFENKKAEVLFVCEGEKEVVAETLRPGYYYETEVLRPAMVKVKRTS